MKRLILIGVLAMVVGVFLGKYYPEASAIVTLLIALILSLLEPTLKGRI